MIPFRVYDREKKEMWIVLNEHNDGTYLVAREDESESDGDLKLVKTADMLKFKLVDFLEEAEDY